MAVPESEEAVTLDGELKRKLVRGAGVNYLGTMAKSLYPVLLIVTTRLYGPAVTGTFLLACTILEVFISLTIAGYQDGLVMYVARHQHRPDDRGELYNIMANAFVIVLSICGIMVLVGALAAPLALARLFDLQDLVPAFHVLIFSLPFMALPTLMVACTKGLMIMKYDALLLGLVKPLTMVILTVAFYFFSRTAVALCWVYLLTHVLLLVFAARIFAHHFSYRELFASIRRLRFHWNLTAFAVPQNLNMTFNYLVSDIGILFLGIYGGSPASIAFYKTGSELLRNVRHVRMGCSAAFAPLIARLHHEGRRDELAAGFSNVSEWAFAVAIPVVLLMLLFRQQLLLLFHSSYTYDSSFMLALAAVPLISCAIGTAGIMIVMTGHSRWNLANSICMAVVSAALNMMFVPRWGLMGAAVATATAVLILSIAQLIELRCLLGVSLRLKLVYRPYLAGAAIAVPLVFGGMIRDFWHGPLLLKIPIAAATIVAYAAIWLALKAIAGRGREARTGGGS